MTDHPITPPPELVEKWRNQAPEGRGSQTREMWIATQAAQWGADQELEACLLEVGGGRRENLSQVIALRDARRPKPPSLKELALAALQSMRIDPALIEIINDRSGLKADYETIRLSLEQLDD